MKFLKLKKYFYYSWYEVCWCAEAQPAHTALCAGAGHPAL